MRKISKLVGGVTRRIPKTLDFWGIMISRDWQSIVGKSLYEVASFSHFSKSRQGTITAYVNVIPSASIIVRYSEQIIKEQIERYVGLLIVNDIKIIQNASMKEEEPLKLNKVQKGVLLNLDVDIRNKSLKKALEILKTELYNEAA